MAPRVAWIERLRAEGRAGPLAEAARNWLALLGGAPGSGPRGLSWLAREIDGFDSGVQEECALIEGAGALLALFLIHHLRGAHHVADADVHRVKLGEFGFFDPFAPIQRALESGTAKTILIEAIREAEVEHEGRGPYALAMRAFAAELERQRPGLEVRRQFVARVWLDGEIEVDLTPALGLAGDASALQSAIRRLVAMVPGGTADVLDCEEARASLLPRIIDPAPFSEHSGVLAGVDWEAGLRIAFLVTFPGRSRFVRANELQRWDLAPRAALEAAITNLQARSEQVRLLGPGPVWTVRAGDGHDSARILIPELRSRLGQRLGEPFWIGIPHRDALYCARQQDREALLGRVRDEAERAPHRIAMALFRADAGGLSAEWKRAK